MDGASEDSLDEGRQVLPADGQGMHVEPLADKRPRAVAVRAAPGGSLHCVIGALDA